ncbi:MAG: penicillin-binding protein 2 [Coriobacteriales bacterium]|nr:penicillin-binding protein 2 [Coriobacteriales bacterium]
MPDFRELLKPRFAALAAIVLMVLGLLLVRLWTMQVLSGKAYAETADDNRVQAYTVEAPRGRILDRFGRELVSNRPTLAVMIAPEVRENRDLLHRLSTVLDMPADEILERATSTRQAPLKPRAIAIDVPMEAVAYISEHPTEFPGVSIDVQAVRQYPRGATAAHVLGYTGEISDTELADPDREGYELGDIVGKAGAERQFETVLQGDRGYRKIEVDAQGRSQRIIEEGDPIPGHDVRLTIDSRIQKVAEKALRQAMVDAHRDKFPKAKAGAAVALDVNTGEVLAMASAPSYDPDVFLGGITQKEWKALTAKKREYPLTNRAIMAQYPAASTFKAFTGLAGLQTGVAGVGSSYYCEGRWIGMGEQWDKWCWNHGGHGTETFTEGISDSCDVVFYEIGYSFYKRKRDELQKFVRRFGFGEQTGIDLPSEADGRVPDAKWKKEFNKDYPEYQRWLPGDTVNVAIGQGDLLVTPLQIAAAYSGIANDGKVMRPHVLRQVMGGDGKPVKTVKPEVAFDTKVSSTNLATMRTALEAVTTEGTAEGVFGDFPVRVAGKTGTAQVAGKDDYAWFVGFAPAENPKYCVVVAVEQGGHGGSVAGPAARDILGALLGVTTEHVTAEDESR